MRLYPAISPRFRSLHVVLIPLPVIAARQEQSLSPLKCCDRK
jgi:hypothetical protein